MPAKRKRIIVADCESDPFEHGAVIQPFIWGAFDGGEYHEFQKTEDFVTWAKAQNAIIYAHNGGKFDWHFILDYLEPFSRLMIISGRLAKIPFGEAELRDSYSILPVPLSQLKKDDFDYAKMRKEVRHKHMAEIRQYLENDCRYLFEYVSAFIEKYGTNLTAASAALAQWRKITGEKTPETTRGFYETFSPYYYGGRVQCFEVGEIHRPFQVIDINSAYPFAMLHAHAWGKDTVITNTLPTENVERCFITLSCDSLGAFPFRTDKGLSFPSDGARRVFNVTGWEYCAARDTGALQNAEIHKVYRFIHKKDFSQYVNYFYAQKVAYANNKDVPEYHFAKLFMNSLYGKWAANPDKYRDHMLIEKKHVAAARVNEGYEYAGDLGGLALVEKPLSEARQRYFNVATGASITGFVRAMLHRAMHQCEGVLYCDTDSIAAEGLGSLDLDPERLGAWDVEAQCTYGAIAGKKLYAFKTNKTDPKKLWKVASKGVRLTPDQIVRVACGEEIRHEKEAPTLRAKKPVDWADPESVKKAYTARNVRRAS